MSTSQANRSRPPPPPVPGPKPGQSTPGSVTSAPSRLNGESPSPGVARPTPPSIPMRTYKSAEQRTRPGLARASSKLYEQNKQATGENAVSESDANKRISVTSQTFNFRTQSEENQKETNGSLRSVSLSKSGSNRHLMMQMDKINSKISPPNRTAPTAPVRTSQSDSQSTAQSPFILPPPIISPPLQGSILSPSSPARSPGRRPPPPPVHPSPKGQTVHDGHQVSPGRPPPPIPPIAPATAHVIQSPPTSPIAEHALRSGGKMAPLANAIKTGSKPPPPLPPPSNRKLNREASERARKALDEMLYLRPKLVKFYEIHRPERLSRVDKILATYGLSGGEQKLNEALLSEYSSDLHSITLTNHDHNSNMAVHAAAAQAEAKSIIEEVVESAPKKLMFVKAKHKFAAEQEGDLGFEPGQIIEVTDSSKQWWSGTLKGPDGKQRTGVFPSNYVQEISEDVVLSLKAQEETLKPVTPGQSSSRKLNKQASSTTNRSAEAAKRMLQKVASNRMKNELTPSRMSSSSPLPEEPSAVDNYSPELVKEDIFATHYFKAVLEVVTSEYKYVIDLFVASFAFVNPMIEAFGRDRTDQLVPGWMDIARVHEGLLMWLIEKLPDVTKLETDFGNDSQGSRNVTRRSSHVLDNDVIDQIAQGNSAKELKAAGSKFDALEDAFARLCESGRSLTSEQRVLRVQFISEWVRNQCEIFAKAAPFLKTANRFISNYHNALETLEKFSGEELTLLEKLEAQPILKNLKLRDFLIKPVQRVCKYPLLLREIIKYGTDDETKLAAVKAQESLMTIADQVNTMMRLNESGNAKKLAGIRQNIRPVSDVESYELNKSVLRREGELYVVACEGSPDAPGLKAMKVIANQLATKTKGAIKGLLFLDQFLLVEVTQKFLTKAERIRIVHGINVSQSWESIKVEKTDQNGFSLTLTHAEGPARGTMIVWKFKTPPAARDGWVDDLLELSERLEKVRERKSLVKQQELKQNLRRSGLPDEVQRPISVSDAPARPARTNAPRGGIMSLIDELKTVQSHKLDSAKKNMV